MGSLLPAIRFATVNQAADRLLRQLSIAGANEIIDKAYGTRVFL